MASTKPTPAPTAVGQLVDARDSGVDQLGPRRPGPHPFANGG